ncbi:ribonuclease E/G [Hyphococcus sp.]|uniref:ribonuclease E/G n=1 Tax=Hyphococcus sp. TaxID=2038636 RepID=UPI002087640A|nr:MAG: RNA-binding protein [Marinicaulis sp.]
MIRRLIIECGAAETRAALLIDGKVWKFWFGPARGDEETDTSPRPGRRFAGRVLRVDNSLRAAFIQIGGTLDGFLTINKTNAPHCVEGAMASVEIKTPPRQQKGAVLRFVGPLDATVKPGRLPPFLDSALEAVRAFGAEVDEVAIDDGDAARVLTVQGVQNVVHEAQRAPLFARFEIDAALDAAFRRDVPLIGGGALTIDETQALTAIDVDTGDLTASSPERLREKIAVAAMSEAIRQISLRNIGGHVVIDLPKIKGDSGRKKLQQHIHKELSRLDKVSAAGFSKSGLFSFVLPHLESPLLERYAEEGRCQPQSGRRFKLDFLARRALGELENHLRATPSGKFQLAIGAALEGYLTKHAHWCERLRAKYGSRFEITPSATCGERSHDISEQR